MIETQAQAVTVARAGELVVLAFDDLEDAPPEVDESALKQLARRDEVALLGPEDADFVGDELHEAAQDARDADLEALGGIEQ